MDQRRKRIDFLNLIYQNGAETSYEEIRLREYILESDSLTVQGKYMEVSEKKEASACRDVEEAMLRVDGLEKGKNFELDRDQTIDLMRLGAGPILTASQSKRSIDSGDARGEAIVEPTISTKEALADIMSMFSKPLPFEAQQKKGHGRKGKIHEVAAPFEVYCGENILDDENAKRKYDESGSPKDLMLNPFEDNFDHMEEENKPPEGYDREQLILTRHMRDKKVLYSQHHEYFIGYH